LHRMSHAQYPLYNGSSVAFDTASLHTDPRGVGEALGSDAL